MHYAKTHNFEIISQRGIEKEEGGLEGRPEGWRKEEGREEEKT